MTKATYESARKLTNRLSKLRQQSEYLKRQLEGQPDNFRVAQQLSALEWALPILENYLIERFGEKLPERLLYGSYRHAVVLKLIRRDGRGCYLCEQAIDRRRDMSVDHVLPLAKGGADDMDNYKLTHTWCNIRKGNMTLELYRQWQKVGDAS